MKARKKKNYVVLNELSVIGSVQGVFCGKVHDGMRRGNADEKVVSWRGERMCQDCLEKRQNCLGIGHPANFNSLQE